MPSSTFPLRMGSAETFATVRNFLRESGYTDQFLRSHFRLLGLHPLLYSVGPQGEHLRKFYEAPGVGPFLARLFVEGQPMSEKKLQAQLPDGVLKALKELRLLEQCREGWQCPVLLMPPFGLFVASDRGARPMENVYQESDYVMSGVETVCWDYAERIPMTPCGNFLDMGTGAGIAAMLGARCAQQSYGIDITERATRFADFNRALNGIENLKFLQGDMFAPVAGMQFDRITANLPFEPPLKKNLIFSVGGEDGEAILKRFVAEVPPFLAPGGRVYALVLGTDRESGEFEERIREWLGDAAQECDVALLVSQSLKPVEYATQQILGEGEGIWKMHEWNDFYRKLRAGRVVLGHLLLQKRKTERPVFFTRRQFGPQTGLPEMEWLMAFETFSREPGFADTLLQAVAEPGNEWHLEVKHALKDGALKAQSYTFVKKHPFAVEMEAPTWMGMLASSCDGKRTYGELCDMFVAKGLAREEFVTGTTAMISADVLRLTGHYPPEPRPMVTEIPG